MPQLKHRLDDYLTSNNGYIKSLKFPKINTSSKITQTIALGLLPSLAQLSLVSAQCQGAQATNLLLPSEASNPGLEIDVDGDGTNDFKIFDNGNAPYFATLHMVPLNGGTILTNGGSGTAKNYAANEAINGNGNGTYGGFVWLVYQNSTNNAEIIGPWAPPYPSSGYLGVKQGGFYGFIELTIHSGPVMGNTGADYVISVAEAGLASAPGSVLAGDCSSLPLPVELVRFSSEVVDDLVTLNWETASEVSNAGFEIQRSKDGVKFETLSFVEGKGDSNLANTYTYQDNGLQKGNTYYYRLKQVDFSGRFEFSEIINVTLNKEEIIGQLYPNPSDLGKVMLDFNIEQKNQPWTITVFDVTGKQIFREVRTIEKGQSVQTFDLEGLTTGAYFFKIENEDQRLFRKVFISK